MISDNFRIIFAIAPLMFLSENANESLKNYYLCAIIF